MILVKLYTAAERRKMKDDKTEVLNWRSVFSSAYHCGEPPFRDDLSVDFLKQSGVTFVEGDWYSVIQDGMRMPMSSIHKGLKIALAAISCSRQNKYLWYDRLGYDIFYRLANLPLDMLFAIGQDDLEAVDSVVSGELGCKFIDFPYQGSTTEVVHTRFRELEKDGYQGILCDCNGEFHVFKRDDGTYCCDQWVSRVLQYRWWEDIDHLIKYIDSCSKNRVYLARPSQTYSLLAFSEILSGDENTIAGLDYLSEMRKLQHEFEVGKITKGAYESGMARLQSGSLYDTYIYFRDKFKVVCHIPLIPEEPHEILILISVNKYPNGTYQLTSDRTYFDPKVCDAVSSMLYKVCGDYAERVTLAVRKRQSRMRGPGAGEFYIGSVEELVYNTVFGMKATEDSIELFDVYEAVQIFGAALKEVQGSGKCIGYTWIRRVLQI